MTDKRREFTVINGTNTIEHNFDKRIIRSYQTNPMKMHGESLREEFLRFRNGEGGRKFTVEDLLRS